jgi:diaminohydroxyphosphoribosylaminopyrimidine deaminase/5-amino-6-(5-phosphoribosylamino)uracil reductase
MPFVMLKSAMSLDGKIATVTKESKYITGLPARQHVHMLRVYVDAVMIGVNTVKIDDPALTVRDVGDENITKRNPKKIVLDTKAKIPLRSKILKNEPGRRVHLSSGPRPKAAGSILGSLWRNLRRTR